MALIVLQLLLRQGEGRITHQRRHGNLDPFWTRALSMRATTVAVPTSLPQGTRDFLARRALRLAEACLALISRIAQHSPHRRPFPPRRRLSVSDRTRFWNETLAKPSARFVTLVACDEAG